MRPPSSANPHWRPCILSCPFCLVDFKIIGKLEEMSQDTFYILSKSDLHSNLIDIKLKMNPTKKSGHKNDLFWAEVDDRLIKNIYEVYKLDFEAFDYDPVKYFQIRGLNEKGAALLRYLNKTNVT